MLIEFATFPVGGAGESLSPVVAQVIALIDDSGLDYQLTAMGTLVEGDWDEVMALVKRCHDKIGENFSRVYTKISIDDRKGATGRLKGKVDSVEQKAGKEFSK